MLCGEKLRELRGTRSQSQIANEIGVTKSAWAMYERNERTPRDEIKIKIANFFGKSVQEIFFLQQQFDNEEFEVSKKQEELSRQQFAATN